MINYSSNAVLIIGMVLLFLIGFSSTLAPYPIAPYSLVIVIPGFALGELMRNDYFIYIGGAIGGLMAPILFIVFTRHSIKMNNPLPKLSIITFAIAVILSFVFAYSGWETTVRYTSMFRANALVAQAILPILIILVIMYFQYKKLSINHSIVLHWFAFAWLCWGAFPWYGELL